jgi:hypothetical protein
VSGQYSTTPTATNLTVGVNKWGSGPSAAFIKENESPWVFGAVVNNIWSFGGPPGSSDRTNQFLLNPIVSYHFGDVWSGGSSPNITTNWIASGGQMDRPQSAAGSQSWFVWANNR